LSGYVEQIKDFVLRFKRYRLAILGTSCLMLVLLLTFFGPFIVPYDAFDLAGDPFQPPSSAYPMGTDNIGRDVFAGIIYGTRTSLYIGGVAVIIAFAFGVSLGAISGYAGRRVDEILMRFAEIFQVLPSFIIALVIISLFGATMTNIILTLAIVIWPQISRLTRAQFLAFKERDFVTAARAIGVSAPKLIFREIFPNAIPPVLIATSLRISGAILLESGLAFLGFSDPDVPSLGRMLGAAQHHLIDAPWLAIFPGLFIMLTTVGVNLIAEVLNEMMNPKHVR
jgi:peptide/nickel transport system permease protein